MSYLFGMDETEKRQQLQQLAAGWDGQNDIGPTAFEGVGAGVGQGLMRGGAKVGKAVALAGSVAPIAADALTGGTDAQDWYFENVVDEVGGDAVDYWTPNAGEVGTVGQVLGSLGEIVLPLMAGAGNPSLLAGTTQLNVGAELVEKGVDADTAGAVSTIAGGATALGAWLPFFGKSLAQRVGMNAAANVALGAAERGAEGAVLAGAGYDQLAAQYDPFDMQAAAVDALTGAAFGAIYRGDAPDLPSAVFGEDLAKRIDSAVGGVMESLGTGMKPSDVDAAFAARNVKQFQIDSAPGRPVDADSWSAHGRAQETAMRQMLNGEPVDVGGLVDGASFQRRPYHDINAMDDFLLEHDPLDAPQNRLQEDMVPVDEVVTRPADGEATAVRQPAEADADPDIAALQQILDEQGDFDVRVAVAADEGEASVTRKASELMQEADDVIAEADTLGRAIRAAANCFIGRGA